MFEADLDELDLGSNRNPVKWVSTAPPLLQREKRNPNKRNNAQRRARNRSAASIQSSSAPGECSSKQGKHDGVIGSRLSPRQEVAGQHLDPECEEGNIEYKLRLKEPTPQRFHQLVTQLKFRLSEGNGECFYYVGVEDDGFLRGLPEPDLEASLSTLRAMACEVQAAVVLLHKFPGRKCGACALLRVYRLCLDEAPYTDLRVAVVGGLESGKSTLVAVLTHGREGRPLLDDGRGAARLSVLRHKHEIVSGRTSSIAQLITGYDAQGRVLNYAGVAPHTPAEIATLATKVLRFIDLGGHEKYLKTALYGLTCMLPDHVLLCVCPCAGLNRVTREHLAAALALDLPLAILLTKVDQYPRSTVEATLQEVRHRLAVASGMPGAPLSGLSSSVVRPTFVAPLITCEREAVEVAACARTHAQVQAASSTQITVPVFAMSSVTGAGLSLLHAFFSRLQPLDRTGPTDCPPALGAAPGPVGTLETVPPQDASCGEVPMGSSPVSSVGIPSSASSCSSEDGENESEAAEWSGQAWEASPDVSAGSPACDTRTGLDTDVGPLHFQVDHTYEVKGVGSVVSGTVVAGTICLGQHLLLGPSLAGTFESVCVSGIQRAQLPVRRVKAGQHATLAIQPYPGSNPAADEQADVRPCFPRCIGDADEHSTSRSCDVGEKEVPDRELLPSPGIEPSLSSSSATAVPFSPADPGGGAWREFSGTRGPQGSWTPLQQEGFRIPRSALVPLLHGQMSGDAHSDASAPGVPQPKTSPPPHLVGSSPSSRKGAVLLHGGAQPKTAWQFEAVLVLLSGHWPARGLLSRRWPPQIPVPGSSPDTSPACLGSSPRLSRLSSRRLGGMYSPIIHCGSVRQAAHVVHMEEVPDEVATTGKVAGCSLASAVAAGAALLSPYPSSSPTTTTSPVLHYDASADRAAVQSGSTYPGSASGENGGQKPEWTPEALGGESSLGTSGDSEVPMNDAPCGVDEQKGLVGAGCTARVRFRFVQRPEWLRAGARLIVRDPEDGGTAGAGVVERVHWGLDPSL